MLTARISASRRATVSAWSLCTPWYRLSELIRSSTWSMAARRAARTRRIRSDSLTKFAQSRADAPVFCLFALKLQDGQVAPAWQRSRRGGKRNSTQSAAAHLPGRPTDRPPSSLPPGSSGAARPARRKLGQGRLAAAGRACTEFRDWGCLQFNTVSDFGAVGLHACRGR